MRAISLWQPWASAMVTTPPLKCNETRDWRPGASVQVPFQLVIHAAKRWTKAEQAFCHNMRGGFSELPNEIPLGKLLGVCTVMAFRPTEDVRDSICIMELNWGNYADGRWAWVTEGMVPFKVPVPWKGAQGFFNVPDEVVAEALNANPT